MNSYIANVFFVLCLSIFCLNYEIASADQNDPKLNLLFSALKNTLSKEEAIEIQQEIWARWTSYEADAQVNQKMQFGMYLINAGALTDAERLFGSLAEVAPNFAEVWNKRATVRFMRGDLDGSKQDIVRVLQLEPRHFGALAGLGMIHVEQGNFEGALLAYQAATRHNPHMEQVKTIIARLKKRLQGEPL